MKPILGILPIVAEIGILGGIAWRIAALPEIMNAPLFWSVLLSAAYGVIARIQWRVCTRRAVRCATRWRLCALTGLVAFGSTFLTVALAIQFSTVWRLGGPSKEMLNASLLSGAAPPTISELTSEAAICAMLSIGLYLLYAERWSRITSAYDR